MVNLVGTYECKVDAKGRLMVPAAIKKQLTPVLQDGFVLKRSVFQKCLELYPMDQWNSVMKKIGGLNPFRKKNNDFVRRFTAGVKMVEVDPNGRLLIPKDLINYSEISKDIVLTATLGVLEIWDKEKYENAIGGEDDFAELAEEVMGNREEDGIS